jgi:hypothetical protein
MTDLMDDDEEIKQHEHFQKDEDDAREVKDHEFLCSATDEHGFTQIKHSFFRSVFHLCRSVASFLASLLAH